MADPAIPAEPQQTQGNTASPSPSPAATSAPSPSPIDNTSASSVPSGTTSVGATPGAAATPTAPTWLSSLRDQGFEIQGDNESDALASLVRMRQELQQLKPVVPYVQSYMRYASDFNRFLAQQKAGGQQAQPNAAPESWEKKFWSPPEYNPNWASMIQRDAQGNLVPVAGAPPDVVPKYMAYVQYQKDHFDKFMSNPIEYLRPIATEIAREIAQNTVREHFGQHQGQQTIDGFINSNAKTLYEIGPDGNVKTQAVWDPARGSYTQQRVLSKAGQLFADYARNETAWQAKHGIHDPQRIIQVAWQAVGRDFGAMFWGKPNGAAPASQPPPANPREQANQKFLTQNNTGAPTAPVNGNSTPFTPPPGTQGYVEPSEILRRELASAGLSLA